jgi:hypothetical protein
MITETEITETEPAAKIERALTQMRSLREGEAGVLKAVQCGGAAIPGLRALLFERDRSGIYQPRCLAVRALFILGARDVLFDYLSTAPERESPVERLGDDAVINAAAECLARTQDRDEDEEVFQLLLRLASRRYWPGVIAALARYGRPEAIPYLAGALAEDDCRLLAAPALLTFGRAAVPALLQIAAQGRGVLRRQSETGLRTRQRALALLLQIGIDKAAWRLLRPLIAAPDPRLALNACALCLASDAPSDWPGAVQRLRRIADSGDWLMARKAEDVLRHTLPKAARVTALHGAPEIDARDGSSGRNTEG